MTKMMSRRLLASLLVLWPQLGQAQTETLQPSPAQAQAASLVPTDQDLMSCLVHRSRPPAFPHSNENFLAAGSLMVRLQFDRADRAPVPVFVREHATALMRAEVEAYLEAHRLPCLPEGRVLTAWQSFRFHQDRTVDVMPPALKAPTASKGECLVSARYDRQRYPAIDWRGEDDLVDVIVALRFAGEPNAPPEVRVLYSNAGKTNADSLALTMAADYRLPCRSADDPVVEGEQTFRFMPDNFQPLVMRRLRFGLMELLEMSVAPEALVADFDLDSMGCPFSLDLNLRRPTLANALSQVGAKDVRRGPLLEWLSSWTPQLSSARAQRHLFGTTLRVEVPCGHLKLQSEAS